MSAITPQVHPLAAAISACSDRIYAVPGYPVSDLVSQTRASLVINEKVALEFAIGDSLAGRRACVIVKHVGMNALVDPLVHATFQGIRAGVVIVCGDDPTARNTMTVQDCRTFSPVAGIPVFEGAESSVISDAFAASETYSRVALVRLTPDQLSMKNPEELCDGNSCTGDTSGQPGSLADPDLTMYGRAARAAAGSERLMAAGLAPFPFPPLASSEAPVSRKERGFALTLCSECPFRLLFEIMHKKVFLQSVTPGAALLR